MCRFSDVNLFNHLGDFVVATATDVAILLLFFFLLNLMLLPVVVI